MAARLILLVHGATSAQRAGRVMTPQDRLEPSALRPLPSVVSGLGRVDRVSSSPSVAALETVAALALPATTEPALRDLDLGRWTGRALTDIARDEPDALAGWLGSETACPHGGESVASLLARTGRWMQQTGRLGGRTLAVTHAAVARAAIACALGGGAAIFWRVDLDPLCLVRLDGRDAVWTLRHIVPPNKEAGSG